MLPSDKLSTINVPSILIGSRAQSTTNLIDYEDGPIALSDPSQGLHYQTWLGKVYDLGAFLEDEDGNRFDIFTMAHMTSMSFTFDQNGRPTIVYTQYGVTKLWWYDTTVGTRVTTNLGSGVLTPKLFLDDKRIQARAYSDIILGYIRNENLYYRQQRDRFNTERLLASNVIGTLKKIGMGSNLRVQFRVANY